MHSIPYSKYFDSDSQSSKWDRVRVNYDLIAKVIEAKENQLTSKPQTNGTCRSNEAEISNEVGRKAQEN